MKESGVTLRNLLIEQQIINPSFTHYGGLAGFQDYGIVGCRIKKNFLQVWRTHFLTDNVDEVEVPDIVPYAVLKASGHVDKFTDPVVTIDKQDIRADHLVKEIYRLKGLDDGTVDGTVDSFTREELEEAINANLDVVDEAKKMFLVSGDLKADKKDNSTKIDKTEKDTKTEKIQVRSKSLMLCIDNGLSHLMRPEIAQTIYPNFRRYYDYHKGRLPFGIAQTGRSYRNEICPKPFERLRSFHQAEIEYFYDPSLPHHPSWKANSIVVVPLLSADSQTFSQDASPSQDASSSQDGPQAASLTQDGPQAQTQVASLTQNQAQIAPQTQNQAQRGIEYISLGEALNKKIIKDEITATFIGKVYTFAISIGLKPDKIRFRQHQSTEMAHYAVDCWDLECFVDERWLECVGIANRNDYDLRVHDYNNQFLLRRDNQIVQKIRWEIDAKAIAKSFKNRTKEIFPVLQSIFNPNIRPKYPIKVLDIELGPEFIKEIEYSEHVTYYPCVIEPSFGIDRLLYAILEQNYWIRLSTISEVKESSKEGPKDATVAKEVAKESDEEIQETRQVLSLKPKLAPYQVAVLQLSNKDELLDMTDKVASSLRSAGISVFTDSSGTSIGRRYTRIDRLGIPLAVTVDFESIKDNTVTLRNRDDTSQIRVEISNIMNYLF